MNVLHRLDDAGGRSARDLVEALALRSRPQVAAVMIMSADGRAAVQGRSVALGHPADRALLREVRASADAVLVGRRTLEAERYAGLLDPDQRARRLALGLPEHPVVATIARHLDGLPDVPLLHEEGVPVRIYTQTRGFRAPAVAADLRIVELGSAGVAAVLDDLAAAGLPGVACEGGPGLLREVAAAGRLDHLLLTVAPLLAAGDAPTLLTGMPLDPPAGLTLAEVHRAGEHVFLHYRAGA